MMKGQPGTREMLISRKFSFLQLKFPGEGRKQRTFNLFKVLHQTSVGNICNV